eukprot:NODE_436_length_7460_cov_0.466105.p2 type:complete len:317 gc:universal NODE_436_length_7460_cov_0.466105:1183-233(-)
MRKVAATLSIIIAITTLIIAIKFMGSDKEFAKMSEKCLYAPHNFGNKIDGIRFYQTGFLPIDRFLCMITAFFDKAALKPKDAAFTSFFINSFGLGAFMLVCAETGRSSARGFVAFGEVVLLLGQIIGISVAVPLFWLPSMWLLSGKRGPILSKKVGSMTVSGWATAVALLPVALSEISWFAEYMMFFNFILPLLPLVIKKIGISHGEASAVSVLNLFAGMCAAYFFKGMLDPSFDLGYYVQVLQSPSLNGPLFILILDMISLLISMALFVAVEGGKMQLVSFLIKSFTIGPGAAILLYCSWEERNKDLGNPDKKNN